VALGLAGAFFCAAVSLLACATFVLLQRLPIAKEHTMLQHKTSIGLLIVWVGFVGFVIWLDWLGGIAYILAGFPVWFGRSVFFLVVIVLLLALSAVLLSKHMAWLQRDLLTIGMVWLLVLPFIPWKPEKVLIIEYFAYAGHEQDASPGDYEHVPRYQ
jgi:preprotein translocase subunit Sss1